MGRKGKTGKRLYVDLEPALRSASKDNMVSCDKKLTHKTRKLVEQVVRQVITAMKKTSPAFASLYSKNFGGGSIYDGLKIGTADEFDIDILLKIPKLANPVLVEDKVPGFAQLKLKNFQLLSKTDPAVYKVMKEFVDEDNFLLPKKMKSSFMQSIFDQTVFHHFPNGDVKISKSAIYNISKVQHQGPALTLTLNGPGLNAVAVDLVPSILMDGSFWPAENYRSNFYSSSNDFFLAPTTPKQDHVHRERFWRLSFHMQERKIIFNRFLMKPAIRVLKRLRDHFNHGIRSYAIKTVFMWELCGDDHKISDLWNGPLSYTVIYMLEKYLMCLKKGNIPDFWNKELNLLCHLSDQQLVQYTKDVDAMVRDLKTNPTSTTLMKYLQ